jgi:hypothetical protein
MERLDFIDPIIRAANISGINFVQFVLLSANLRTLTSNNNLRAIH